MLVVEGQGPHAAGTWSGLQIGGGMTGFPGVPDPEGRLVWGLSFGQQAVGANQGNPVKDVWQGIWRPEEYTERTVLFGVFSPCSGGPSVATTLWLHDPNAPEPYIAAVAADTFYETVHVPIGLGPDPCYANCDNSTTEPVLNVDDFTCFISEFAAAQALPPAQQIEHYANCDGSTTEPILNVDDFTCFIDAFAQGCP